MNILKDLDAAVEAIAMSVATTFPIDRLRAVRYVARWTPAGDVGSNDFWTIDDQNREEKVSPEIERSIEMYDLSKRHWQLTQDLGQPRWYKMIVTVERSGKFAVEFEYKDDYQEGDIMRD